jgi:hypothetical protein
MQWRFTIQVVGGLISSKAIMVMKNNMLYLFWKVSKSWILMHLTFEIFKIGSNLQIIQYLFEIFI